MNINGRELSRRYKSGYKPTMSKGKAKRIIRSELRWLLKRGLVVVHLSW